MEFLGILAGYALAALGGCTVGVLFNQRIRDWFAGVEKDLRAKANEAGTVVIQAAHGEVDRIRLAGLAAADKAVAAAKTAVGIGPGETPAPTPVVPPAPQPAA